MTNFKFIHTASYTTRNLLLMVSNNVFKMMNDITVAFKVDAIGKIAQSWDVLE